MALSDGALLLDVHDGDVRSESSLCEKGPTCPARLVCADRNARLGKMNKGSDELRGSFTGLKRAHRGGLGEHEFFRSNEARRAAKGWASRWALRSAFRGAQ